MTAKKQAEEPAEIPASQPAEVEKDVVGSAEYGKRVDAATIASQVANDFWGAATAEGNRLTFTFPGPDGLVQTFHATVEEGIREF